LGDREDKDLLPFARGRLVSNFDLLKEYWRVARERGREDLVEAAMLSEPDYRRVAQAVVEEGGRISLGDLWDKLTKELEERIDPEIALEAAKRAGYNVDAETARNLVARQLAAWLIEAAEYWNFISTSEPREGEESSGREGEQEEAGEGEPNGGR